MTIFLSMTRLAPLLAVLALAACNNYAPHGTLLDPPMEAPDFELESADGALAKDDLAGQLVVLFFGFTHCPDVCPDTMARLARAMRELDERQQEQIQVVLVSVDPERDSPDKLQQYAGAFHPSFIGATARQEEIDRIASGYGIYQVRVPLEGEEGYTIDHTAAVLVLNRRGETVLIWSYGTTSEEMASDLAFLLRRS
jgi:protein SCO1